MHIVHVHAHARRLGVTSTSITVEEMCLATSHKYQFNGVAHVIHAALLFITKG